MIQGSCIRLSVTDTIFSILLILFILNFAILDSLTTNIALGGNCYESNFILEHFNIDLLPAKLAGSFFVVLTAIALYYKDREFAIKAMLFFTGLSVGIVLNNIFNILGGFS